MQRKRPLRNLLWAGALALVLGEIAVRVFTTTSESGLPKIGKYVLLPYRPEAAVVEQWWSSTANATYMIQDAELGWSLRPGGSSGIYHTNAQALRAAPERVYAPQVPAGKLRILALGDSFTHGDEVENDATWTRRLEMLDPRLETLNLGVPGYGTDQAFLRWRQVGSAFESDIVLLGIWPEDICRNLNLLRFYLVAGGMFSSKPRFVLSGGELRLLNSPVAHGAEVTQVLCQPESARMLEHEAWYSPGETEWKPCHASRLLRCVDTLWSLKQRRDRRRCMYTGADPSAIDLTVAIAQRFRDEVRARGATPLVLLIPMRDLLDLHAQENGFPLVRSLRESGVDVIDLGPPISRRIGEGAADVFLPSGHFSAQGNELVARELAAALEPWLAARPRR